MWPPRDRAGARRGPSCASSILGGEMPKARAACCGNGLSRTRMGCSRTMAWTRTDVSTPSHQPVRPPPGEPHFLHFVLIRVRGRPVDAPGCNATPKGGAATAWRGGNLPPGRSVWPRLRRGKAGAAISGGCGTVAPASARAGLAALISARTRRSPAAVRTYTVHIGFLRRRELQLSS